MRAGLKLQDPGKPKDLTQIELDGSYAPAVEARFHGSVTDQLSWVANFNATLIGGTLGPTGSVGVEDLIAQYKLANEFQIWAGRLLVPSDRSNFAGPFFMIPWNYPGFYVAGAPLGPKDGPNGRDQGVTVWGNALDAKLKYYVGAYALDYALSPGTATSSQPYYSGRISYTIQGSEGGYFGSSTYYGAKNIVTIGVGGQYQKNGAENVKTETAAACPGGPNCKDNFMFMGDLLVEEATSAGTFTFEGQYYKFTDGYVFAGAAPALVYAPEDGLYALVAYLAPKPINLQPMVRLQQTIDPGLDHLRCGPCIRDQGLRRAHRRDLRAHRSRHQHHDHRAEPGPKLHSARVSTAESLTTSRDSQERVERTGPQQGDSTRSGNILRQIEEAIVALCHPGGPKARRTSRALAAGHGLPRATLKVVPLVARGVLRPLRGLRMTANNFASISRSSARRRGDRGRARRRGRSWLPRRRRFPLHEKEPLGDAPGERQLLLDQEDRDLLLGIEPANHFPELVDDARLNALGRLVEQHALWLQGEGTTDGELLLLPAGQVTATAAHHRAQDGEEAKDEVGNVTMTALARERSHAKILLDRELWKNVAPLRDVGDSVPRALRHLRADELMTTEADTPRGGRDEPHDGPQAAWSCRPRCAP